MDNASNRTAQRSEEPSVVVEGVRHAYKGGTVALDGVDLEIGPGLFGLLGPNGAGKSTLMRIVCTLLVPTAGRARVGGLDVVSERSKVRPLIGYLPQEFGAWRLHRVAEVLDTLALLSGLRDRSERGRRVSEVLESVGLDGVADRKVKKLSGGMLRRLGVAQALVHEPQYLVVDEPTVGLDPEERIRFRELMANLGRERVIVLSTHIVADLGAGCHDLALIDRGQVVFRGSPGELVERARGQVFELTGEGGADPKVPEGVEMVSRAVSDGVVRVRVVVGSADELSGGSPVATPTLEEGYLAFMAARGRVEVAVTTEPAEVA
jgi:ABC-type multidrug transport system ATPase subunit